MRNVFFGVLAIFLSACQSVEGVLIAEQPYSLKEISHAVAGISGKPREVSDNQREILSAYFGRKVGAAFDPNTAKERLYAHFYILGDRRPYDIRVQVIAERKTASGYSELGEDVNMSQKVADELKAKLVQSQDGTNVIDSFRPF